MPSTQTTLIDSDTDDTTPTNDDTPMTDERRTTPTESDGYTTLAPPDQRGGEQCCPWCLAAAETFEHHDDGSVGCGHCDAAIPVGTKWYEQGEKIVL